MKKHKPVDFEIIRLFMDTYLLAYRLKPEYELVNRHPLRRASYHLEQKFKDLILYPKKGLAGWASYR